MSRRIRSFGSAYVRNSADKALLQKMPSNTVTADREELIDAIASDLGEELDKHGIAVIAFDDAACERFACNLIARYELLGRIKD